MRPDQHGLLAVVGDESWRRELCPECGARLVGLAAWKAHSPCHDWGSDWFAARIRAALPGEIVHLDPRLLATSVPVVMAEPVVDTAWKAGLSV
jgi:hypothetical protein